MAVKTNWKENRPLAAAVLALSVLVGVLGIGGAKVAAVARGANDAFAATLQQDLNARTAAAESIVAACTLSAEMPAAAQAQQAVEAMHAAKTPAEYYAANTALGNKIEALYEMEHALTSVEVGSALQTQLSEFRSRGNIIDNEADTYNEKALAAEKKLRGFPAALLARMIGGQAEAYR